MPTTVISLDRSLSSGPHGAFPHISAEAGSSSSICPCLLGVERPGDWRVRLAMNFTGKQMDHVVKVEGRMRSAFLRPTLPPPPPSFRLYLTWSYYLLYHPDPNFNITRPHTHTADTHPGCPTFPSFSPPLINQLLALTYLASLPLVDGLLPLLRLAYFPDRPQRRASAPTSTPPKGISQAEAEAKVLDALRHQVTAVLELRGRSRTGEINASLVREVVRRFVGEREGDGGIEIDWPVSALARRIADAWVKMRCCLARMGVSMGVAVGGGSTSTEISEEVFRAWGVAPLRLLQGRWRFVGFVRESPEEGRMRRAVDDAFGRVRVQAKKLVVTEMTRLRSVTGRRSVQVMDQGMTCTWLPSNCYRTVVEMLRPGYEAPRQSVGEKLPQYHLEEQQHQAVWAWEMVYENDNDHAEDHGNGMGRWVVQQHKLPTIGEEEETMEEMQEEPESPRDEPGDEMGEDERWWEEDCCPIKGEYTRADECVFTRGLQ